jgi:hypothetical protein
MFESVVALSSGGRGVNSNRADDPLGRQFDATPARYAARQLEESRVMLLAIYRSDELDRTHPLTRTVPERSRSMR